jgi:hypothetical protein
VKVSLFGLQFIERKGGEGAAALEGRIDATLIGKEVFEGDC